MFDIQWPLFISAFLAGIVTFLAPCTLPLVPAFLGVISGVQDTHSLDASFRRKTLLNAFAYVLGFSLVFIILGSLITVAIEILAVRDIIQKIGGLFLVVLGLTMGGWLKFNVFSRFATSLKTSHSVGFINSFILGSLFSLSWTPCIGPILASILLLASLPSSVGFGIVLLGFFCLGLGLPFIFVALFYSYAVGHIGNWARWAHRISQIGGIIIVVFGILLLVGRFEFILGRIISLFFSIEPYERFIYRFM